MRIFGLSLVTILLFVLAYYAGTRGWVGKVFGAASAAVGA